MLKWRHLVTAYEVKAHLIGYWQNLGAVCFWQPIPCALNDPTNSVKTLKEARFLRLRLQSHQVHPTALTIIQHLCIIKQKRTKYKHNKQICQMSLSAYCLLRHTRSSVSFLVTQYPVKCLIIDSRTVESNLARDAVACAVTPNV